MKKMRVNERRKGAYIVKEKCTVNNIRLRCVIERVCQIHRLVIGYRISKASEENVGDFRDALSSGQSACPTRLTYVR